MIPMYWLPSAVQRKLHSTPVIEWGVMMTRAHNSTSIKAVAFWLTVLTRAWTK
jgi:hypothetical protein